MRVESGRALLGWLLVLLVGLGGSAWQLIGPPGQHAGRHGGHGHATDGPQPLFAWQPHEARRIELHARGRSVDMVRTEAGWQGAPDGFDAEAFVTLFSRARADRRFEPMPDGDYGLDPGLMTFLVKGAGERVLAGMIVGDSLPDGIGRYVRSMADSDIIVIPDYQVRPLMQATGTSLAGRQQADDALAEGRVAAMQQEDGQERREHAAGMLLAGAREPSAPMGSSHMD